MKVKELIKELEKIEDKELEIGVETQDGKDLLDIVNIEEWTTLSFKEQRVRILTSQSANEDGSCLG